MTRPASPVPAPPSRQETPPPAPRRQGGPATRLGVWLPAVAAVALGASAQAAPTTTVSDPAEKANRAVFAFNRSIDRFAIAPVARGYAKVMPAPARKRLKAFTANLEGPGIFVNDMLQANFRRAGATSTRFAVNSTVGLGGLFDVADRLGVKGHEADMGQTFGRWGVGAGPSVQVPLLGPSNARDFAGDLIGGVLSPTRYLTGGASTAADVVDGVDMVDSRAQMLPLTDELQRNAPDYYVALRDKTAEGRAALVAEAKRGGGPE